MPIVIREREKEPLGAQIKQLAKERGIPIYKLEEKANLPRGAIAHWDDSDPGFAKVRDTLRELGVDITIPKVASSENREEIL